MTQAKAFYCDKSRQNLLCLFVLNSADVLLGVICGCCPRRLEYRTLFFWHRAITPGLSLLPLKQLQGESLADDLQGTLWCSPPCPTRCHQSAWLVNPMAFKNKALQLSFHSHCPVPGSMPFSAMVSVNQHFTAGILPSLFSQTQQEESTPWAHPKGFLSVFSGWHH